MSIIFADGFDLYSDVSTLENRFDAQTGVVIHSSTGRTASNALEFYDGTSSLIKTFSPIDILMVSYSIRAPEWPASDETILDVRTQSGTLNFQLKTSASNTDELIIIDNSGNQQAFSTPGNTIWTRLEIKADRNTSELIVRLGAIQVAYISNASFSSQFDRIEIIGHNKSFEIDDIVLDDNNFIGDLIIDTVSPNGIGNSTNFQSNLPDDNYKMVNEQGTHDGVNSTVSSSEPGDLDLYTVSESSYILGVIVGIQEHIVATKTGEATRTLAPTIRSSGQNINAPAINLEQSFNHYVQTWQTNPLTNNKWTTSDLTDLQIGFKLQG